MKKVLFCGQLFPATGEEVLRDQAVLIDGETIEAVMPRAQFGGEDYQVIDLSDKFVTPGLIDAHVPVYYTHLDVYKRQDCPREKAAQGVPPSPPLGAMSPPVTAAVQPAAACSARPAATGGKFH